MAGHRLTCPAMPRLTVSHGAASFLPPSDVWAALQHPRVWEAIPGIDRVVASESDGDRLVGFEFLATVGGRAHRGRALVDGSHPETSLTLEVETADLRGSVTVRLEPGPDGTRVEVTVDVSPNSLAARLAFPMVSGGIERDFPETVERFVSGLSG